ncbi:hypothetical protein GOO49_002850 [Salmonella enterica]|nr:hypothetical protein [Salmonella enterica]
MNYPYETAGAYGTAQHPALRSSGRVGYEFGLASLHPTYATNTTLMPDGAYGTAQHPALRSSGRVGYEFGLASLHPTYATNTTLMPDGDYALSGIWFCVR